MATQTTLTSQGLKDLEERLEHVKSATRKEIAEKIVEEQMKGSIIENPTGLANSQETNQVKEDAWTSFFNTKK